MAGHDRGLMSYWAAHLPRQVSPPRGLDGQAGEVGGVERVRRRATLLRAPARLQEGELGGGAGAGEGLFLWRRRQRRPVLRWRRRTRRRAVLRRTRRRNRSRSRGRGSRGGGGGVGRGGGGGLGRTCRLAARPLEAPGSSDTSRAPTGTPT